MKQDGADVAETTIGETVAESKTRMKEEDSEVAAESKIKVKKEGWLNQLVEGAVSELKSILESPNQSEPLFIEKVLYELKAQFDIAQENILAESKSENLRLKEEMAKKESEFHGKSSAMNFQIKGLQEKLNADVAEIRKAELKKLKSTELKQVQKLQHHLLNGAASKRVAVNSLKDIVGNLEDQLETLKADLRSSEERLKSSVKEVDKLQGQLESTVKLGKEHIEELKRKVKDMNTELSVSKMAESKKQLEDELRNINAEFQKLEIELQGVNTELSVSREKNEKLEIELIEMAESKKQLEDELGNKNAEFREDKDRKTGEQDKDVQIELDYAVKINKELRVYQKNLQEEMKKLRKELYVSEKNKDVLQLVINERDQDLKDIFKRERELEDTIVDLISKLHGSEALQGGGKWKSRVEKMASED